MVIYLAVFALVFAVSTAVAALVDVARHPRADRPVDPPSHVHVVHRPRPYDWNDE